VHGKLQASGSSAQSSKSYDMQGRQQAVAVTESCLSLSIHLVCKACIQPSLLPLFRNRDTHDSCTTLCLSPQFLPAETAVQQIQSHAPAASCNGMWQQGAGSQPRGALL
jgi:hypothetical protein